MANLNKFSFAEFFGLNKEQEAAVDVNKNISLSAGAGSGKTRVLTSRFLTLLDSGVNIDEIVAITFTEKAALEMKGRIRSGILDKIDLEDKQSRVFWQKQLDNLNRANINTIHSFCTKIVRENAAFLGIDFNFGIISDVDKNMFLNRKLSEIIEEIYNEEKCNEEVKYLSELYEGEKYSEQQFYNDIFKIREDVIESGEAFEEIFEKIKEDRLSSFILNIVKELNDRYYEYKISRDVLDFGDLQKKALEILEDKLLCSNYKERYNRFLVDEFQDTNEIQRKILYKLVADDDGKLIPKRLFVVGDFKQAIYGFRGTDFTIFKKVSQDIGEEGQKSLQICYRSEAEIIEGINEIFKYLIEDYQPLKYKDENAEQRRNNKEKRINIVTYTEEKSDYIDEIKEAKSIIKDKKEIEELESVLIKLKKSFGQFTEEPSKGAEAVIKSIKMMRDKGLSFKDICILVRGRGTVPEIEEQLNKYKIPYCIIGGTGFYDKSETKNILNLFELAVNGFGEKESDSQLIKLLSVLKSPLFQLSDDVLLKARQKEFEKETISYVEAMFLIVDDLEDRAQKERLKNTYTCLKELETAAMKLSVVKILEKIIECCSIREMYLAQKNGAQMFRNIEKLLKLAEQYDKEEFFSQHEFIEYIEVLDENSDNEAEAALDTEDSEAVKIMTIHASKGLEFEGVIVPNIERDVISLSKRNNKKVGFIFDNGSILSRYNMDRDENESLVTALDKRLIKEIDEEVRILYVAMTRAKQYIVVTGKEQDYDGNFILDDNNKVENLNTYEKMIKYAAFEGRACVDTLAFINSNDLAQIEVQEITGKQGNQYNAEEIRARILFKPQIKPRNYASASKYMSYSSCPRKYYYENILMGRYNDYTKIIEEKFNNRANEMKIVEDLNNEIEDNQVHTENLQADSLIKDNRIKATDKGILAHKVLEYMDRYGEENYEKYIEDIVNNAYLEEDEKPLDNNEYDVENLKNQIKAYVKNYLSIEENEHKESNYGELIKSSSEVSYLLAPLKDRKMMINGFIDRLKIYKKEDKQTAVIIDYKTNKINDKYNAEHFKGVYSDQLMVYGKAVKELLNVDEIILKLYMLDSGESVSIKYNENEVNKLMMDMDEGFYKMNTAETMSDYKKVKGEKCSWCKYREVCL